VIFTVFVIFAPQAKKFTRIPLNIAVLSLKNDVRRGDRGGTGCVFFVGDLAAESHISV
jgi:hypothetical protein